MLAGEMVLAVILTRAGNPIKMDCALPRDQARAVMGQLVHSWDVAALRRILGRFVRLQAVTDDNGTTLTIYGRKTEVRH